MKRILVISLILLAFAAIITPFYLAIFLWGAPWWILFFAFIPTQFLAILAHDEGWGK
jgi:hypothetical protein